MTDESEHIWRNLKSDPNSHFFKWNYQEWFHTYNSNGLFIVQPDESIELYELWLRTYDNSGDRYDDNSFKCIASFPTLKAAKLAYLMRNSLNVQSR